MRAFVRSARRVWSSEKLGLLGLAATLPLLGAGVVSVPRARILFQEHALQQAEQQHLRLLEERRWLEHHGPLGEREFDLLLEKLQALLPDEVDQVALLAAAERVAAQLGFDLHSVELGKPEDVGLEPLSRPIGEAPVVIHGRGDAAATVAFLDGLRACGFPFELTGVSLRRPNPNHTAFSVELRLGLYAALPETEFFDPTLLGSE
jgi:hypothetical protein